MASSSENGLKTQLETLAGFLNDVSFAVQNTPTVLTQLANWRDIPNPPDLMTQLRHLATCFDEAESQQEHSDSQPAVGFSLLFDYSRSTPAQPQDEGQDEPAPQRDDDSDRAWSEGAGETSVFIDEAELRTATTLHELFLTPQTSGPTSNITSHVSSRVPRGIELQAARRHQMQKLIFYPNLISLLVSFIQEHHLQNPENVTLSPEHLRILTAGSTLSNCWLKMFSEADVERNFIVTQAHPVAEAINIMKEKGVPGSLPDEDRLYPHKGTPGRIRGESSRGTYPDVQTGRKVVEIKTLKSINKDFISNLLDWNPRFERALLSEFGPDSAFEIAYRRPQSLTDRIGAHDQPVVQLATQFWNKDCLLGAGSSGEFAFFLVKDPANPDSLIISPILPTFPVKDGDSTKVHDPTESAIYILYISTCIANDQKLTEEFLVKLRTALQGRVVQVHTRDIAELGRPAPGRGSEQPSVNVSKGTVGVHDDSQHATDSDSSSSEWAQRRKPGPSTRGKKEENSKKEANVTRGMFVAERGRGGKASQGASRVAQPHEPAAGTSAQRAEIRCAENGVNARYVPPPRRGRLRLPHLSSFTIHADRVDLRPLFDALILPALQGLVLRYSGSPRRAGDPQALWRLLTCSACVLTRFSLREADQNQDDAHILSFLSSPQMAALKKLYLQVDLTEKMVHFLTLPNADDATPGMLVNLNIISLLDLQGDHIDDLALYRMVVSRLASPPVRSVLRNAFFSLRLKGHWNSALLPWLVERCRGRIDLRIFLAQCEDRDAKVGWYTSAPIAGGYLADD
ncbi:hypothetical protein FB45DRAFT_1057904 [Roridomyces roridus]|uniref:Uncharacterized protein n=1 Tax=Roridomyces roridus TaxID=1738132 RepID=A0AAD7BWZ7_9AGAR|nr:hypothetical protein FB45DRAFT_1057904 [Roridomyces roridus]